ncbi:MAG TPA: DUF932 domain-containing protein [Chloroflexota bacterium]
MARRAVSLWRGEHLQALPTRRNFSVPACMCHSSTRSSSGPRRPAWHELGQVSAERIGAVEALRRAGQYDVILARSGNTRELGHPPQANRERSPVAHLRHRWTQLRARPARRDHRDLGPQRSGARGTLGAVRYGRCLFIAMQLPSLAVRGDSVSNYLIAAHWMDASGMTEIFTAPVRVVCQNTLMLAKRHARQRISLEQGPDVRERLAEKLAFAVRNGKGEAARLQQRFESLADREAAEADIEARVFGCTGALPSLARRRRCAERAAGGQPIGSRWANRGPRAMRVWLPLKS